jgi:phosphoribosylanthranilate isomerase
LAAAAAIRRVLPPFVTAVALLRNPDAAEVEAALEALKPVCVQFHGEEPEDFCAGFGVPYLKALAMRGNAAPLAQLADRYRSAAGLILDGNAAGEQGGQGRTFDWRQALDSVQVPIVLAGGLTPANVAAGIALVGPYAVDVSSGIDADPAAAPGVKDWGKMCDFVRAVRRADHSPIADDR